MIRKQLTTLALTAGCALVLAAAAQAQPYPQTAPQSTQTYNYQQQSYNPVEPQQQPTNDYQQQAYNAAPPQVVTNGPQVNRGDRYGWSPRENVIESRHYDNLLETSLAFRHFRERKECGPVTDPQLRGECFASFRQYEPFRG
jgi:hypothetical protein